MVGSCVVKQHMPFLNRQVRPDLKSSGEEERQSLDSEAVDILNVTFALTVNEWNTAFLPKLTV